METNADTRPPRGALAVVAVGLVACAAAWLLSTDETGGSSVAIKWATRAPLPDSRPAAIPGGGSMRLQDGGLRATEANINGERVYRATSVLRIAPGSAVGQARVRCRTSGARRAELGRTVDSRGAFPRSTGEYNLTKQEVPGSVGIRLPIQGAEFASLELEDAFETFTDLPGVVVSWLPHRTDSQEWQWGLPEGRPQEPLGLGFASFWRTAGRISADVSCTLENDAGSTAVRTAGSLR
ncbi:MAG TPA: hypothetical protein VNP96_13180 [Solirubrobacterales bacterium]|nr:hypothetical protein [Solirubrobacterales bacterium]